jgi:preprotein translocase subunit SecF
MFGVKPSIDFTGGSLLEITVDSDKTAEIETTVKELYELSSFQQSGPKQYSIKGPELPTDKEAAIIAAITSKFGATEVLRFETIGPTLSKELVQKTFVAIGIVAVVIMTFIARQFKEWKYGICAILAMLHDSLVLLGSFSLLGHFFNVEVDVLFVTAVLTTLSFSVHDTIVVYHRIREVKQKNSGKDTASILNTAVMGTITRSLNNSLTIILMLTALSLLGGESIRWFAVALLIGAVTGTYSSTCTAVPLLYVWEEVARALRKRKTK